MDNLLSNNFSPCFLENPLFHRLWRLSFAEKKSESLYWTIQVFWFPCGTAKYLKFTCKPFYGVYVKIGIKFRQIWTRKNLASGRVILKITAMASKAPNYQILTYPVDCDQRKHKKASRGNGNLSSMPASTIGILIWEISIDAYPRTEAGWENLHQPKTLPLQNILSYL